MIRNLSAIGHTRVEGFFKIPSDMFIEKYVEPLTQGFEGFQVRSANQVRISGCSVLALR